MVGCWGPASGEGGTTGRGNVDANPRQGLRPRGKAPLAKICGFPPVWDCPFSPPPPASKSSGCRIHCYGRLSGNQQKTCEAKQAIPGIHCPCLWFPEDSRTQLAHLLGLACPRQGASEPTGPGERAGRDAQGACKLSQRWTHGITDNCGFFHFQLVFRPPCPHSTTTSLACFDLCLGQAATCRAEMGCGS